MSHKIIGKCGLICYSSHIKLEEEENKADMIITIPNKNNIARAATMDNPAPERDASVKSLGIFLKTQNDHIQNNTITLSSNSRQHKYTILKTRPISNAHNA